MRTPSRPNPSPPDAPIPWAGWLLYAVFVLIVATFCIAAALAASEPAEPSGMTKTVTCELRGWDVPPQFC